MVKRWVKGLPYIRDLVRQRDGSLEQREQLRLELVKACRQRDDLRASLKAASAAAATTNGKVLPPSYEPDLLPTTAMMRQENVASLEGWYRWAEEWSMLLRVYGNLGPDSAVLEIGCGFGRIGFVIRYILDAKSGGRYHGFDVVRDKIDFLQKTLQVRYPNYRYEWAPVYNTHYNPTGTEQGATWRFPHDDGAFDLVYAASVFTHMLPENTANYIREAGRVLKPGGRCVFSFFLLDHYHPNRPRPGAFAGKDFNFDHRLPAHGDDFACVSLENPEQMTAYRLALVERMAADAGLRMVGGPVPGMWSGHFPRWVSMQDVVVLERPAAAVG